MSESSRVNRVTISAVMRELLDQVRDSDISPARYTSEVDAAILEYWPKKNKEELAKVMGFGVGQLRKRYKELTNGGSDV